MSNEQTFPVGCKLRIFEKGDLSGISLMMQDEYYEIYKSGYHDEEMLVHFRLQELSDKIIFDVGGFIGMSSLTFAKAAPTVRKICCFEPNPWNFNRIKYNLSLNPELSTQIEVYDFALGSENEFEDMLMSSSVDSGASSTSQLVCGDGTDNSHETLNNLGFQMKSVCVRKLDTFVEESGLIPDIIKLDVEGAEALFLEGAKHTLNTYKPLIYIEFHSIPATLRSMRSLHEVGYNVTILKQEPDKRILAVADYRSENSISTKLFDFKTLEYELENFRVIHQKDAYKIDELDQKKVSLNNQLIELQEQYFHLQNQFAVSQSQLADKIEQLAFYQTQIADIQCQFDDTKNQLMDQNIQYAAIQAQLTTTQAQLTILNEQQLATQGQLVEKETLLVSIQNQLVSTQERLNDKESELSVFHIQLKDYSLQLTATQNWLNSILHSTSWRITKPLRFIKEAFTKKR